jgi:adenylate cyclase
VTATIGLIDGYFEGKQIDEFYEAVLSSGQVVIIIYTLLVYMLIIFYLQINRLLGEGVLFKFLKGKYYSPTEEERIFMFLDVKSSTSIAERLGHRKYYSLLNEFFHEISEPVLMTKAEIYQYVGDEVVFTWGTKNGLENANCLEIFFMIKKRVNENRNMYLRKYGVVPEFKAGVHYGKVISGQIGDIKREVIYNGDVLNTTARIQEQCNKFERELLTSGRLLDQLDLANLFKAEKIDTAKLRGKESNVEIYSVNKTHYL